MRKPGVWSWVAGWAMAAAVGLLLAGSGAAAQLGDLVGATFTDDGVFIWNGVVYDAPGTGEAVRMNRVLQPGGWGNVGLADACHDVLDATVSTMSTSAWETLMTCVVDVPETTDRVLATVTGQFAWMGTAAFAIQGGTPNSLCEIPDPAAPASLTCRVMDSRIREANGVAPREAGGVWIVDAGIDDLCEIPDPTAPAVDVICRALDAQITDPSGVAPREAGGLWIVDAGIDDLCEIPDPTAPAVDVVCRALDAQITDPQGAARREAGGLWIVDDSGNELCEVPDPTAPTTGVTCRAMPSPIGQPLAVASRSLGGVWVEGGLQMCEIPNPAVSPISVSCRPSAQFFGMTEAGPDGECMIRLARGTTAVETIAIAADRLLLDTTFVDLPGIAGSATYNVQMMTGNPVTFCTAVRETALGTTPLPSLLVQVFHGS